MSSQCWKCREPLSKKSISLLKLENNFITQGWLPQREFSWFNRKKTDFCLWRYVICGSPVTLGRGPFGAILRDRLARRGTCRVFSVSGAERKDLDTKDSPCSLSYSRPFCFAVCSRATVIIISILLNSGPWKAFLGLKDFLFSTSKSNGMELIFCTENDKAFFCLAQFLYQ